MPYVQQCIESVLSEPYQDWEMLIGDNGSADGTIEYLRSLSDDRIQVYAHEENLGIFGNLNFLFSRASAPICQILCADDFIVSDGLNRLMKFWDTAIEEIGFISSDWKSRANAINGEVNRRLIPRTVEPHLAPLLFFFFGNMLGNLSSVSVRKRVISDFDGFDPSLPYAGDFEFWSRASKKHKIFLTDMIVTYVRSHPKQASFYLGANGELFPQLNSIFTGLYFESIPLIKDFCDQGEAKLISHYCRNVGHFMWRLSIRSLLSGNVRPLKELLKLRGPLVKSNPKHFYWLLSGVSPSLRMKPLLSLDEKIFSQNNNLENSSSIGA